MNHVRLSIRCLCKMATNCGLQIVVAVGVLLASIIVIWGSPCVPTYCETVPCTEYNDTTCDLILPSATVCGCCSTCITFAKENEKCDPISSNEFGAMGTFHHCGPKLQCQNRVCTRRSGICQDALDNYTRDRDNEGWIHIGQPKPECDENGNYFRKQCRPGSMCYCADRNGEQIFGNTSDEVPITEGCACSREFDELKRVIRESSLGKWMNDPTLRSHHFLRCLDTGDYDPLQCIDDKCFCLNETMHVKPAVSNIAGFRNLSCYNPNYHDEMFFRRCERELKWKTEQKQYLESQGHVVIGMDFPSCDPDGTYGPKQCRMNECFCADKDGNKIQESYTRSSYSVKRYDPAMTECRCPRESVYLQRHGLTKKVKCDKWGNYERKQCLGPLCYCVDPRTGNQIGHEFDPLKGKDQCNI